MSPPPTKVCCCRTLVGDLPPQMWLLRPRHEKRAQPERSRVPLPQRGQRAQRRALSRVSQDIQQPVQSQDPHAHPGTNAFQRSFLLIFPPFLSQSPPPHPPKPSFLCAKACLLSSFGKFFVLQHKDQLFLLGEKKRGRRPRLPVPETAAAPSASAPFASATPSSASASAPIPPQPLSLEAPQANPTPPQPPSKAPQAKDSILDLSAPKTN